jgi:cob(I)alamin adenosyltransferase
MASDGLVMVYTGDGKGKTTAALGLAMRAIGHGKKVLMVQFLKGDTRAGECKAASYLPGLTIVQKGSGEFVDPAAPRPEDRALAREALELARRALSAGDHDLVILDEVNVAVDFGLLAASDVLAALEARRPGVDVVLTGRHASPELVKRADMVSEVLDIKHHFHAGATARAGIEY